MTLPQFNLNPVNTAGKLLTIFQRNYLEKKLEQGLSDAYSKRIKIMLLADEGKTQTQICQELGCSQSTARHWIAVAKSGQAHQWNNNAIGKPQAVSKEYLQRLRELVNQSPREVKVPHRDFTYSASRWTAKKLSEHLSAELGIKISDRHINRLLKQMGLSTRTQSNNLEKDDSQKLETKNYSKSGIVIRDIPKEFAFS
ncbi:helix-turn-helix domain-containing protein [Laspinema olomoucense]|uniref:helix-turn-helix domain-containing protein n=1 Tax=Laspinema olomoucense TaxID=3231600 RepID=UPI0021BA610B|nr:helix-turn-helix domain-containing protein [Laspinema sp. D3a]MCT7988991.1 helix-turn-helix domain-containing protein [Laspinema sp. D3a]